MNLHRLVSPDGEGLAPLPYLRERVLRATLVVAATGGLVAYLPGAILAWSDGAIGVAVVDTLCYLAVVAFALRPDIPYAIRAGSLGSFRWRSGSCSSGALGCWPPAPSG